MRGPEHEQEHPSMLSEDDDSNECSSDEESDSDEWDHGEETDSEHDTSSSAQSVAGDAMPSPHTESQASQSDERAFGFAVPPVHAVEDDAIGLLP